MHARSMYDAIGDVYAFSVKVNSLYGQVVTLPLLLLGIAIRLEDRKYCCVVIKLYISSLARNFFQTLEVWDDVLYH